MGDHTLDFQSDDMSENWLNSKVITPDDEEGKFEHREKHIGAKKSYMPAFPEDDSVFDEMSAVLGESGKTYENLLFGANGNNKIDVIEEDPKYEGSNWTLSSQSLSTTTELVEEKPSNIVKREDVPVDSPKEFNGDSLKSAEEVSAVISTEPDPVVKQTPVITTDVKSKCPQGANPGGRYFRQTFKSGCCRTEQRCVYIEPVTGRFVLLDGRDADKQNGRLEALTQAEIRDLL